MSHSSDARVDTEDDPYNAEPQRSDPWATGPAHTTQDDQTERFVPEQRDAEHDGHLYASDSYAEPDTTVLPDGSTHQEQGKDASPAAPAAGDEPTAVGVAHVDPDKEDTDGSADPTAVVTPADRAKDEAGEARTDAAEAQAKADQAEAHADEAKADELHADDTAEHDEARHDDTAGHDEARYDDTGRDDTGRDETGRDETGRDESVPAAELAATREEPAVVVEPVPDPVPVAVVEPATDGRQFGEAADLTAVAVPVGSATDEPYAGSAAEAVGEMKPGDVPVTPVAGFFAADAAQGLRDRWRDAQLGFVDDPRKAVDDVKALVGEAVEQFTAAVSAQRDELDAAAGDDTEQYRVAVQRYRAFFDRLLGL